MSFCGVVLKPGAKETVHIPDGSVWHLSQICLHEPKAGKNYVQVQIKGTTYTLTCLEKDKAEHTAVDLFFGPDDAVFSTKGASEVHLLGYVEPTEGQDDMDDEDEEEESEEAAPATKASPKAAAAASPKVAAAKAASPKAEAKASPKAKAAAKAEAKAQAESDDDDESEEEDLEEGEEEESGEEDEEVVPDKAPPAAAGKRKAAEQAAPPAGKKAKGAAGSPAAKPAASPASKPAASDPEAAYVQEVHAYLKKNGATDISRLGTAVKRPPGVPKMKVVFGKHPGKFAISGEKVSAK